MHIEEEEGEMLPTHRWRAAPVRSLAQQSEAVTAEIRLGGLSVLGGAVATLFLFLLLIAFHGGAAGGGSLNAADGSSEARLLSTSGAKGDVWRRIILTPLPTAQAHAATHASNTAAAHRLQTIMKHQDLQATTVGPISPSFTL